MSTVIITRTQPDYGFTATDETGNTITMDNAPENGAQPYGIRPMQGLLIALGGCSGIDIVSILKKQRQPLGELTLEVTGEREKDVVPALWETVHIRFEIGGGADPERANHAAKLSVEKYCSVAETLRRAGCKITWEVHLS